MKKVLSLVLALTLVLALGIPAFAGGDTTLSDASGFASGAATNIAGTTEGLTLKVTVPSSGAVTVNPYNLSVTPSGGTATTDTIISATQRIKSETKAPLSVSVTLEGTPAGDAKFAAEPQRATNPPVADKTIFLGFEIFPEGAAATAPTTDPSWKAVLTRKDDGTTDLQIGEGAAVAAVSATAVTYDDVCTLEACDATKVVSTAAYHLIGDTGLNPDAPWTASDKVDVKITFTFGVLGN